MRYLLLALLLVPSFAIAEDYFLPEGCYVTRSDPTRCFYGGDGNTMLWVESSDQRLLSHQYGPAMALVMSRAFKTGTELAQCLSENDTNIADYNGLIDEYNTLLKIQRRNAASLKKQNFLISKLRKKCGKPCKNIK